MSNPKANTAGTAIEASMISSWWSDDHSFKWLKNAFYGLVRGLWCH